MFTERTAQKPGWCATGGATFASLLLALALLAACWHAGADAPGLAMDEGMTLLYPELLWDGKIPQRDFESYYPPGNVWFLGALYALFGAEVTVARAVGWFYQVLVLAGVATLVRPFGWGVVALSCALCGAMFSLVGLTPFAWFLALACLVWTAVAVSRKHFGGPGSPWPAVAGALAAMALTARHDIVLAASALLAMGWLRATGRSRAHMMVAFAIAMIPFGCHAVASGWASLWENLVTMPLHTTRPERRLPFSAADLSNRLAVISAVLSLVAAGVALGAPRLAGARADEGSRSLLAAALCAAGVLPQMLQMVGYPHVVMGGTLSLALLPAGAMCAVRGTARGIPRMSVLILASAAAVSLCASGYLARAASSIGRAFAGIPSGYPVTCGGRTFYVEYPHQAAHAQGIADYLSAHARPGERLICGPSDLGYTPATDTCF